MRWNNRFEYLVGKKQLIIWKLMSQIKNEVATNLSKLALQ